MEREKEQMMREKEELMLRLQDYAEKTRKAEKGGRGLRPGGLGRQGRRSVGTAHTNREGTPSQGYTSQLISTYPK